MSSRSVHAVRFFDGASVQEGSLHRHGEALSLHDEPAPAGVTRLPGLITGLFTDHHVHLQLVEHTRLTSSRLGMVIDLGADLEWISGLAGEWRTPQIRYAGPFLTAPGGYPSDRSWAPLDSVREVTGAASAAVIISELADAGVSCIKIIAHSGAGPMLDDETVRAIVQRAARHRLPVIAHAEGPGQAQRVVRLGATRLAHAPFSERLSDEDIAEQAAAASWISTMAIHDGEALSTVIDNVRRFVAAGGEIAYGTDMGNGPTPVDLREAEVDALRAAGVEGDEMLAALAPADPLASDALLLLPGENPAHSHRLTLQDLPARTDLED